MKTGLALSTAAAALSLGHANAYDSKMTAMSVVQQDNHLISAGTLNVTTGKFVPNYDATIALPNSPHCHWAPLQGTEGVGTATFHVNRSMFFLAQQICGSAVKPVVNQTVLVASRIPLAQDGETFIYNNTEVSDDAPHPPTPLDKTDPLEAEAAGNATIWHSFPGSEYNYPLDSWNLVWDHVCNFIVVTPRAENSETVFETWMISEFDAQARQQKDLTRQPARPKGWAKVNGLGALDFYNQAVGGPWTLNCGDNCSFFELEATAEDPSVTRIVGRNFHTGEVLSNISNTLGVSSLVSPSDFWSQEYSDFIMIGLGHCCTELGCDTSPVCKDSPDSVALVGYGGAGSDRYPLTALATLGSSKTTDFNDTLRLGVVLTYGPMGVDGPVAYESEDLDVHAYVYVDGAIETFQIEASDDNGERHWSAKKIETSAKTDIPAPAAWTIGPFSW